MDYLEQEWDAWKLGEGRSPYRHCNLPADLGWGDQHVAVVDLIYYFPWLQFALTAVAGAYNLVTTASSVNDPSLNNNYDQINPTCSSPIGHKCGYGGTDSDNTPAAIAALQKRNVVQQTCDTKNPNEQFVEISSVCGGHDARTIEKSEWDMMKQVMVSPSFKSLTTTLTGRS
jgi:hypothetical protein